MTEFRVHCAACRIHLATMLPPAEGITVSVEHGEESHVLSVWQARPGEPRCPRSHYPADSAGPWRVLALTFPRLIQ